VTYVHQTQGQDDGAGAYIIIDLTH
jgi:hypothetical protein